MSSLKHIKRHYSLGFKAISDPSYIRARLLTETEYNKPHSRTKIINLLISSLNRETTYLEIGVRNPADNYDKIKATTKYSVDPGVEFESNPVDFKLTSDEFFEGILCGNHLSLDIRFDVIFIDGLHLAEQVEKDILNSLKYVKDDGYIVLHDCNPPTEWHARESFEHKLSPAGVLWNGTTWKAFAQTRERSDLSACCIDTDWGVGIVSKQKIFGPPSKTRNPYFEYAILEKYRKEALNLISYSDLEKIITDHHE